MKIVSWNVNGLRSVMRKGFGNWLKKENPDVLCLQEIKIDRELLSQIDQPKGYYLNANTAMKKGYSGVLVYSREKPDIVETTLGIDRFDREGRYLELKFKDFSLINLYLPHGGRAKENLDYKLEVYKKIIARLKKDPGNRILIGDFNIAHTDIDLERPKQNRDNIMFTPEERKQLDNLTNLGFTDTFRKFHPEGGNYTWWPYMKNARGRNLGWRIDYCFVSENIAGKVKDAFILPQVMGSDHCPVGINIE